jgi:hypothetical protein
MGHRHFGLISRREDSNGGGGGSPPGSHGAYSTRAELISFPSGTPLERREVGEPSFDERELGSGVLFLAVVLGPLLLVAAVVVGYQAFVS